MNAQSQKYYKTLFLLTILFTSSLLSFGCGAGDTQVKIGSPAVFALLDSSKISGEMSAYKDQGDDVSPCPGKAVQTTQLQNQNGIFKGSLDLHPGAYKICASFYLIDGHILISRYQNIEVQVETGKELYQAISSDNFIDRDDAQPSDFDYDGDGLCNLDELLFNLDVRQPNQPKRPDDVVEMPAANFFIGSNADDALQAESPGVTKSIGHFWIDRFEVSRQDYALCLGQNICPLPVGVSSHLAFARQLSLNPDLPITAVTQAAAASYCVMHGGRLPREEEWEYAAIPNGGAYPWSVRGDFDDYFASSAQCNDLNASYLAYSGQNTSPCYANGNIPATVSTRAFGVDGQHEQACAALPGQRYSHAGPCQMAGNVWEWTSSQYKPYPGASWSIDKVLQVVRGGSAESFNKTLRSTFRLGVQADLDGESSIAAYLGFRCVYDSDEAQ